MYSILIAEDEDFVRKGIVSLVSFVDMGISTIYEAKDGEKAFEIVKKHRPDIVLSDINMPILDGINLAKKIKLDYPEIHIIFLTGYDYFDYAVSAIKIGVEDYVLKPASKKDIEEVITKVIKKIKQENKEKKIYEIINNKISANIEEESIAKVIEDNLSNSSFSLSALAEHFGYSVVHTANLVKKELGVNFKDYIIMQRMNKAKLILLSQKEVKIYEVAALVGFEDVNYFSSRFKKYVGHTPKKYQSLVMEGETNFD